MTKGRAAWLVGVGLALSAAPALADDIEGAIESIDRNQQAFTVQGIQFFVTDRTDYDDNLKGFDDLQEGKRVEVDFEHRDGKHWATEIEADD